MKKASPAREDKFKAPGQNNERGRRSGGPVSKIDNSKNLIQKNRVTSKSPLRKLNSSKSNKNNKSMNKDFVFQILGTDSVSDVNVSSWKEITGKDIQPDYMLNLRNNSHGIDR